MGILLTVGYTYINNIKDWECDDVKCQDVKVKFKGMR